MQNLFGVSLLLFCRPFLFSTAYNVWRCLTPTGSGVDRFVGCAAMDCTSFYAVIPWLQPNSPDILSTFILASCAALVPPIQFLGNTHTYIHTHTTAAAAAARSIMWHHYLSKPYNKRWRLVFRLSAHIRWALSYADGLIPGCLPAISSFPAQTPKVSLFFFKEPALFKYPSNIRTAEPQTGKNITIYDPPPLNHPHNE